MKSKIFKLKRIVTSLIVLIVFSFAFFQLGKNLSNFKDEESFQTGVANIKFSYPKKIYQIYEPEPNPSDPSVLSNFSLIKKDDDTSVIEGEFYNATKRDGTKFIDDFITKNKLEYTTIGYRGINNGSQVTAYTKTGNEKIMYYFPISRRDASLYVLSLTIPLKLVNDPVIQKILLSVYSTH